MGTSMQAFKPLAMGERRHIRDVFLDWTVCQPDKRRLGGASLAEGRTRGEQGCLSWLKHVARRLLRAPGLGQ